MAAKAKRTSCGFCSDLRHERCPVVIDRADGHGGPWYCYCAEQRPELHPKVLA